MKRTISGMIGAGSLAHNRRDFIAENVDPDRVHLNICYQNENLKEVYKELFDDSVERYNVGKRKDRQITNYYEKIRQGKQEKLFHEVIFQIGNREDMAVGTTEGDLAVKVLDEYVKNFQQRNPTLHVFSCYLHQDEATPHLHIDFVPYVTGWKGKGMDTRVSLKQALKSLGFQGGNKHDTELNQWINHEKKLLAEIARQYGIEWEQKGTHEEHLDVYNFKKKERKKEVQALEREKEYLTAENEGLTAQIAEARADIQLLKDDKEQAIKDKEEAEKRAEKAEKDLCSLEERRERLQPVMDNVSKEIKEYGTVKTLLPEAGALERAATYRDKKIKPLFIQMKNKIAAMAVQVKELTKEVEKWKHKYQETKQVYNRVQRELDTVRQEKQQLQDVSDRYDRVVRVLGENVVEDATIMKTNVLAHQEGTDIAAFFLEGKLMQTVTNIQNYLYKLIEMEEETGNHCKAEEIAEITEHMISLFGLWDYGKVVPHLLIAGYRKDVEKCIQLIKEVLMESQKPWKMVESPLYYRYADTVQGKSFSGVGNNFVRALAAEIENKEEYEFLKGNKELEAIFSQYLK